MPGQPINTTLNPPTKTEQEIQAYMAHGIISRNEARVMLEENQHRIAIERRQRELEIEAQMLAVNSRYIVSPSSAVSVIDNRTATAARQMAENAGRSVNTVLEQLHRANDDILARGVYIATINNSHYTMHVDVAASGNSTGVVTFDDGHYIGDVPSVPNTTGHTFTTTGSELPGTVAPAGLVEEAHRWMNDELANNLEHRRRWRELQGFGVPERGMIPVDPMAGEPEMDEPPKIMPRFGKRKITLDR